jgi:hypothetical protein
MSTPAVTTDPYAAYGGKVASGSGADPYAAYGGKVAAPAAAAPAVDNRSLFQKAKDNFNANTQGAKPGDGAIKSFVENVGQGGGQTLRYIANAVMHPQATADAEVNSMIYHPKATADAEVDALYKDPNRFIGNAVGQVGTGAILGKAAAPVIGAATEGVAAAPEAIGKATDAVRQYVRPKSSPAIVPPEEVQAQKIAQTILPPGGIKPELTKAIQAQAPAIVEYAQRTGNPLNTQAEGLKAAQGVAAEGLQHYKDQVLAPVAGRNVMLEPANTELGDKATIGDIDSRITELNKLTNTAKANSEGAALDILAKSKWTDEANYLRGKLYSSLEHTTGIPAADIQQLREGYGGEYSLANNLETAQNARLTRTGEQSQGKTNINLPRPSILETPGMVYNAIRGGEQAIADRQFSSAINEVKPQAPARPVPPPIDTDALATQQAAAQQEFLRQHQLEQASQDAAAGRSQRVAGYKAAQGATQQEAASLEGEAARTIGRGNVMQQWADKGAANMSAADPSITSEIIDSLSKSASGKQLLVKASGISPNSSIMKNLIKQARGMTK